MSCAHGIAWPVATFVPSVAMTMKDGEREAVTAAALLALGQWTTRIGVSGMVAMRATPGLLSQVDQHVAHVRRAIGDADGGLRPVSLAAYADGVADVAARHGWSSEEARGGNWTAASWPSVRLLAVCVLAAAMV